MYFGTALEMLNCLNVEAAEDQSKIVDMPSKFSVRTDEVLNTELELLASEVQSRSFNPSEAKTSLEKAKVSFLDKYFSIYHVRGTVCFDKWNILKQFENEIASYLRYDEKEQKRISQMTAFFSPLFDEVRKLERFSASLGTALTGHASKLWARSEVLSDETDNDVENIFQDGIYNVSLFCGKGKIKEERWAKISASWRIDYWDQPDFETLKTSKTSVTRTLVDDYMVKTQADRQKEMEAIRESENVLRNQMKDEILLSLNIDERLSLASIENIPCDSAIRKTFEAKIHNHFRSFVLKNVNINDRLEILKEIDVDDLDQKEMVRLKTELSVLVETIEFKLKMEKISAILAKKTEKELDQLLSAETSEVKDVTDEQAKALEKV